MCLQEKARRKGPQLFQSARWLLHHDNTPAHSALSVQEPLPKKKIPAVSHLPIHWMLPLVAFSSSKTSNS